MQLKLLVRDTGDLDTFAVYVNGGIVDEIADQQTHAYPIDPPSSDMAVGVQFGGVDGGTSAIYDFANGQKKQLARQTGVTHLYLIQP